MALSENMSKSALLRSLSNPMRNIVGEYKNKMRGFYQSLT